MPWVMNCLDNHVSTQAQGKWFTFKPRELKMFYQPEIARFLGQMRGEEGLVEVPDVVAEKDPKDPERIQFLEDKRREGVNARLRKLEWQRHNLLTSLKFDIESKGMKMDPLILATKGDLAALKELNQLNGEVIRAQESTAEQVRKELGIEPHGSSSSSDVREVNPRRENPVKPAKT